MFASLLIGLVAGQRALTPTAVLALALRHGALPRDAPVANLLAEPIAAGALATLALAEMAGDKMASAPDRTVLPGLVARTLTAAVSGAVLAPRGRGTAGLGLAVAAAFGSSFLGLALRRRAINKVGRVPSGVAEDMAVLLAAVLAVGLSRRP